MNKALPLVLASAAACMDAATTFPMAIETPCSSAPACSADSVAVVDDDRVQRAPGLLDVVGGSCVCVDRFEASRATGGAAQSKEGAAPWINVSFVAAKAACELAGKRICSGSEWTAACTGLPALAFPYGQEFDATACNTSSSIGETGKRKGCEGGWPELYDMSGNVAEWAGDPMDGDRCHPMLGCAAYGGATGAPENELACGYRAAFTQTSSSAAIGFRCCKEPA